MKKILLSLLCSAVVYSANAQIMGGLTFFDQVASDWHLGYTADIMGTSAIPVDIDNSAGNLGVYSSSASIKFQGIRKDKDFLDASIGYEYRYYDFSMNSAPFSSMNLLTAQSFYSHRFSDKWGAFGMGILNFGAESSANLSDGVRGFFGAGASYGFNDSFRMGFGLGAISRLENNWLPIPIVFLDWKISEKLSLKTFSGVALIYDVYGDGSLLLNFTAEYVNTEFRLKKYDEYKRAVKDTYMAVSIGATYNFKSGLYISGSIGGNFFRELEFRKNGHSAEDLDIDSAPAFYLHIGKTF